MAALQKIFDIFNFFHLGLVGHLQTVNIIIAWIEEIGVGLLGKRISVW